jgi:hypothetical protein
MREMIAEDYYGERGYLIQKHIDRLMDEGSKGDGHDVGGGGA